MRQCATHNRRLSIRLHKTHDSNGLRGGFSVNQYDLLQALDRDYCLCQKRIFRPSARNAWSKLASECPGPEAAGMIACVGAPARPSSRRVRGYDARQHACRWASRYGLPAAESDTDEASLSGTSYPSADKYCPYVFWVSSTSSRSRTFRGYRRPCRPERTKTCLSRHCHRHAPGRYWVACLWQPACWRSWSAFSRQLPCRS